MSDSISGVRIPPATYPVKPAQPSERDGRPGKRRKNPTPKNPADTGKPDEEESGDDKPRIDEYV